MSNDLSFLEEQQPAANYSEVVKQAVDKMSRLYADMLAAEEAAKKAKRAYDDWRSIDMPTILHNAGISSCELDSGVRVSLKQEITCSPNKNEKDRQVIASWLESHGGGHLIKRKYSIGEQDLDKLKDNGINYMEVMDINTNSLKAWLKGALGLDGISVPSIQKEDIPECVHFFVLETAIVSE